MRKFRKELIRTGTFRKPKDGLEFTVTRGTLDHWALTFSQMRDAGRKVPIPVGHQNWSDPRNNCGWVRDVFVEGDTLVGILELYGDEGAKLACTSDVSIYAEPEMQETTGGAYTWPILHVALCTDPVVPGLGEFTVAASLGKPPLTVPILVLAKEATMPDSTPAPAAAAPATPDGGKTPVEAIKASFRDAVMKAFDDPSLDMAATLAAIKKILKDQEKVLGVMEPAAAPATPNASAAEPAKDAPPVTASLGSPAILNILRDNRKMRLDALAAAGKLNPLQRKAIEERHCSEAALTLSLSASQDDFANVCAVLDASQPSTLTVEKTGPQLLALSRSADDSTDPILSAMKVAARVKP
jgi:hypothetical protein